MDELKTVDTDTITPERDEGIEREMKKSSRKTKGMPFQKFSIYFYLYIF